MVKVKQDLTGQTFGRLKVIRQGEDYVNPTTGVHVATWVCLCSCGNPNEITITQNNLKRKNGSNSCGCIHKEAVIKASKDRKKQNRYEKEDGYYIGYTSNTNEQFFVSEEDFPLIKNILWSKGTKGYLRGRNLGGKMVTLHWLIVGKWYDHKNLNKLDNRRENLRKTTVKENNQNKPLYKNNTSGFTGVSFNKATNKWLATIRKDGKRVTLGSFENKKDAVITRLKAEKEIYGDYAPQRHLFEEYNI